jgi:hypothetical protein
MADDGVADLESALAQGVEQAGGHVSTVAATETNLSINGRH